MQMQMVANKMKLIEIKWKYSERNEKKVAE